MLPVSDNVADARGVVARGCQDLDHIDVLPAEHVLIVRVCRDTAVVAERPRAGRDHIAHGDELGLAYAPQGGHVLSGDLTTADEAEPKRPSHRGLDPSSSLDTLRPPSLQCLDVEWLTGIVTKGVSEPA